MKRDRRGIRIPYMRTRLNGEDPHGYYALLDWYTQGHLTFEQVLDRARKYVRLYELLVEMGRLGRTKNPRHNEQVARIEYKMLTLIMVLDSWDKRKFS